MNVKKIDAAMGYGIRVCLIAVAVCLALATVWAVLAVPGTALAAKPDKPGGNTRNAFMVEVVADDPSFFDPISPLWAPATVDPDCVSEDVGKGSKIRYSFAFGHDLCATLVTSTGATLTDDVSCTVYSDRQGRVTELKLTGQDVIGVLGIMHVSDRVVFDPPVDPADHTDANGVFTLHVHVDELPIWRTDTHGLSKKTKLVEMVGFISIADIVYTPLQ